MSNTDGAGAAQAKTGMQATPLDRSKGMSSTMDALQSRTRSPAAVTPDPKPPSGYGDDPIRT